MKEILLSTVKTGKLKFVLEYASKCCVTDKQERARERVEAIFYI